MKLKTIQDLKEMDSQEMQIFSTAYTYYLRQLEHYVLTEANGYDLVKKELAGFDEEAQAQIKLHLSKVGIIIE